MGGSAGEGGGEEGGSKEGSSEMMGGGALGIENTLLDRENSKDEKEQKIDGKKKN